MSNLSVGFYQSYGLALSSILNFLNYLTIRYIAKDMGGIDYYNENKSNLP